MRIPDPSTEPYPPQNGEQTRHAKVLFVTIAHSVTYVLNGKCLGWDWACRNKKILPQIINDLKFDIFPGPATNISGPGSGEMLV